MEQSSIPFHPCCAWHSKLRRNTSVFFFKMTDNKLSVCVCVFVTRYERLTSKKKFEVISVL